MARKKTSFADRLDDFLATATEEEIRDAAVRIQIWARWRKLGFGLKIDAVKPEAAK